MHRVLGLTVCLAVLLSCGAPRIDSGSEDSLQRSIAKVRESLPQDKRTAFDDAVATLARGHIEMDGMTGEAAIKAAGEFVAAEKAKHAMDIADSKLREKAKNQGAAVERPTRPHATSREEQARHALAYLTQEVPEIEWVEIDRNEAFVGFRRIPADLDLVMVAAALNANRATQFGFHVWAVDTRVASQGWRPGRPGLVCEVTARHGKVESNSCR